MPVDHVELASDARADSGSDQAGGLLESLHRVGLIHYHRGFTLCRFEASNPMHLSPERLYHFMHMSYLRWLSCCYFCPDVWISFAKFEAQFSWERAKAVLDKAVAAIPRSLLLRTAYCDFLEEHHHVDDARSLYEKTLREFQEPVLWVLYMQFERRQRGADAARSVFLKGRSALCHPSLYLAAGR